MVQPSLVQPTFVLDYPYEISPLAKRKRGEPRLVNQFHGGDMSALHLVGYLQSQTGRIRRTCGMLLLTLSLFATFCTAVATGGDVITDTVSVNGGSFDFSMGNCGCPPCAIPCAYDSIYTSLDMYWVFIFDPPLGEALSTPLGSVALGAIPIDSVAVAPESGYAGHIGADINEELQAGHTYVVRTREGGHAVFQILELDSGNNAWTFIYRYQPDGTGVFIEGVPTIPMSWTRIKLRGH